MLNKIWFWLLVIGIVYGSGRAAIVETFWEEATPGEVAAEPAAGSDEASELPEEVASPFVLKGQELSSAALDAAKLSVDICLSLIGVMALWLGMLNIAREAGLVEGIARLLSPLMRWLFPDVPDGHPAQGAMLLNISANMLGLDNAATPFGLKAMKELQTLNETEDEATNAMATFLAINTSNVTLLPVSILALRVAAGSENPVAPLAGIVLATTCSTIVAVFVVRILAKLPQYRSSTLTDGSVGKGA